MYENETIKEWADTVERVESELGSHFGLTSIPMKDALSSVAQPPLAQSQQAGDSLSSPFDNEQTDWWENRKQIQRGDRSVQDVAQDALERLSHLNERTSACVELFRDEALAHAGELDKRLRNGEVPGPLFGMPLAHKDMFHRKGRDVGCGLKTPLASAPINTTVLRRLHDAEALDLGRLHMTELAFDPSGVNTMAGHCRNPWDIDLVPGGSSSGSAVAVAAGAVYGALGSDTGGSVRIPATLCGITALKPTYGLVSRTGAMSLSVSTDHLGPLARTARDCALMLQAIAGYDASDSASITPPQPTRYDNLQLPVSPLRIGVPGGYFDQHMDAKISSIIQQALGTFTDMGNEVVPVADFQYEDANNLARMLIRAEAASTFSGIASTAASSSCSDYTMKQIEMGSGVPAPLYLKGLALRGPLLKHFVDTVMNGVDVLLVPVFSQTTPRIDEFETVNERSDFLRLELTRLARPFNYLGLPSIALPAGQYESDDTQQRLPTGFQLVGRPFSEHLLLSMGNAFQEQTSWHQQRPS